MMQPSTPWNDLIKGTHIIRPPSSMLSTFGTTTFHYVLMSPIPGEDKQSRVREGRVTAERPQILTPDLWKKRFDGFGEESDLYKDMLEDHYGQPLRALEYRFKNDLASTALHQSSLPELTERTIKEFEQENASRKTLLLGPDHTWAFSIMKFIVDMTLRSAPSNFRELEERGFFNPEERAENQERQRIEVLFRKAHQDRGLISELAQTLKKTGHFQHYEDRFFSLVNAPH